MMFRFVSTWLLPLVMATLTTWLLGVTLAHRDSMPAGIRAGCYLISLGGAFAVLYLLAAKVAMHLKQPAYVAMCLSFTVAATLILNYGYQSGSGSLRREVMAYLIGASICVSVFALLVVFRLLTR